MEIIEKIDTPAMDVQVASIPVNPADCDVKVSKQQMSAALRIWGRGDSRFVPSFVSSSIVEESENAVIKEVLHYGKSSMADGSPNLQRTSFREDNLIVTEYLAGPWFMAIAGIEVREDDLFFLLTTVRHKQHSDFVPPDVAAAKAGASKPPPTTEQNAHRVLGIIRELAKSGKL